MSKTWYGHYIYPDLVKGQEFVDFKDYLELDKIIKSKDEGIKNLQGSLQTYEIILKTNLEAYTKENYKQRQIINHLSRKIQNKNKKYRQLNRDIEMKSNDTIIFYARYDGKQYHCVIHCSSKTFSTDLENRTSRSILRGGFSSYELKDFNELKDVVRCLRYKDFTEIDYFEDK
ncbi:MAG: hypothetical protein HFI86_05770 [Bacilli bacterium]|nr:hypothetical protein [Bacilli bacterium]